MQSKTRDIMVELSPEAECSACGCRGLHFCVGRRDYWENPPPAYVGVRRPINGKHEEPP